MHQAPTVWKAVESQPACACYQRSPARGATRAVPTCACSGHGGNEDDCVLICVAIYEQWCAIHLRLKWASGGCASHTATSTHSLHREISYGCVLR